MFNFIRLFYEMKAIVLSISFLVVFLCKTGAQNLVRNPGMDTINYCPAFLGDLMACQYWNNANSNDADYYHLCQPGLAPNNFTGWQMPHSDSGYCGFTAFIYYTTNLSARDYLRGQLISPLESGKRYCFRFYISLSDSSNASVSNTGIYFSQNDPTILLDTNGNPNLSYLPYNPVYEPITLQSDTTNWIEISGDFIAQGGEQFLTIGNFQQDINTTWDSLYPIPPFRGVGAYYYVDDVTVELCPDIPPQDSSFVNIPNVFTPNGDNINDDFRITTENLVSYRLTIYNRWGVNVFESTRTGLSWDGRTTSGVECSDGTYYYVLTAKGLDDKSYILKGFVTLVR